MGQQSQKSNRSGRNANF